jgi:peroxiredoxin
LAKSCPTKLVKATAEGPEAVQSADYFKGKQVALFSVPGAFTPTCSAKHLPGFVEKAADLKAKGMDESPARRSTIPS